MKYQTDDLRIRGLSELSTPLQIHGEYPISEQAAKTVFETREQIHRILHGQDDRLLAVVGPCSIHDPQAALDYARHLLPVRERLAREVLVVMRVYFEKPRTTVGWKGLINDPRLDGSFEINTGLRLARELLLNLNDMGMPAGTEYLDVISPQYVADLISWGAIGARTTESQVHRELASGLSCPVGFKNGTDGSVQVAVDAIRSASQPHRFLSMTKAGHSAIFSTAGNRDCHVILRGGASTNYDADSINEAAELLARTGLPARMMVDCSHANSRKQHRNQMEVGQTLSEQLAGGDERIIGVMIESHLVAGRQDVVEGKPLIYGQSITDACLGWEDTQPLLGRFADTIHARRSRLRASA
ncbi:MAG: 3-deoxy-7-phosphoheptulonate synthase AroG [Gammaproteobacteria bacterium]|nr:3-deoxy-7-phosphoheptulonate synthase AroG [Gammaproteobacteria bacterium]